MRVSTKEFALFAILILIAFSLSFDQAEARVPSSHLKIYHQFNQTGVDKNVVDNCQYTGSQNCQNVGYNGGTDATCQLTGLLDFACQYIGANPARGVYSSEPSIWLAPSVNYTINGWVKLNGAPSSDNNVMSSRTQTSNANAIYWNVDPIGKASSVVFFSGASAVLVASTPSGSLGNTNSWQMITLDLNKTGGTNYLNIYINGTLQATGSWVGSLPDPYANSGGGFGVQFMNRAGVNAGQDFSCQCLADEWSYWDTPLTQGNLTALYNHGNALDLVSGSLATTPSVASSGVSLGGGGQVASIYQGYFQTIPTYTITGNPSTGNGNACITQINLYNYTTLLQSIPENICPNSPTDTVQAPAIAQGLNNFDTSLFFVNATWNTSIFDLNFSPSIPETVTSFHFMIGHTNSTASATGGYIPTPPVTPPETPAQPSCTNPNGCVEFQAPQQSNQLNFLGLGGQGGLFGAPVQTVTFTPVGDVLNVGDQKVETINADWQTGETLTISQMVFGNSPFILTPNTPYSFQGGMGQSNAKITFNLVTPQSFCEANTKTNCLDPNTILYQIPVTIDSKLGDKETLSTIVLTYTVLRPQTVATYTVISLIAFVGVGFAIQRFTNARKKGRKSLSSYLPKSFDY